MKSPTFNTLALKSIKAGKKRYTALIIGILLAMIFSGGGMFFISCMNSSTEEIGYITRGKQSNIIFNAANIDFDSSKIDGLISGKVGYMSVLSLDYSSSDEEMKNGVSVAKLDERASELYYQKLLSGRMPENEGEIAIEKTALARLKIEAEIGDKITLEEKKANGDSFFAETESKTYTLVGILKDRKVYLEYCLNSDDNGQSAVDFIPSAFVYSSQKVALGGKEILNALYIENNNYDNNKGGDSELFNMIEASGAIQLSTDYTFYSSIGDEASNVTNQSTAAIVLCFVLALMSCFAIANSFADNLKDRKKLIGMLRAIGATKRQIVLLFLKEALIICAVCVPLSAVISYFAVKIFAALMGESFIFVPDFKALFSGIAVSVLCVVLSALIPLIRISRLSPMQAVRDIELMRKVKNKKIRSQNAFKASNLLAKRTITFSKLKFCGIIVILALMLTVVCFSVSLVKDSADDILIYEQDYIVYGSPGEESFVNKPENSSSVSLSSQKVSECLELPYVEKITGQKIITANLLLDGEYSDYLSISDVENTNSRYVSYYDENSDVPELTEENFDSLMHESVNEDYEEIKNKAQYSQEFISKSLNALEADDLLEKLSESVTDGQIDIEKLNSGEEIIINAPEEIGYSFQKLNKSGYMYGIVNLSTPKSELNAYDAELREYVVKTAKSSFKAGDYVTLSVLCDDGTGKITRKDKTFKIGAIVNYANANPVTFYTTLEGLSTYGIGFDYDQVNIYLNEECTAEIDEVMQNSLSSIFNGLYVTSSFSFNAGQKVELQTLIISLFSIAAVFFCICVTLINNSITSQIREGQRTIGTLRAVGANEKELIMSYFLQILSAISIGLLSGGVLYTAAFLIWTNTAYKYEGDVPFCLWAAIPVVILTLAVCLINLKFRVRSVSKQSIVENIREL